jgi:hypothetical protein
MPACWLIANATEFKVDFTHSAVNSSEPDDGGKPSHRTELGNSMTPAILGDKGESMRKSPLFFAAAVLLASLSAHAQNTGNIRYKWYDGQGLMHFSDSLTAEAMKYGYDLVNDRGLVVQHVPRQLTPEERTAANKLAAEQAARQRAAQEIANAEAQMLAAYPDEESYKLQQQQALDTIDQQIHTTQINLRSQEKALTDLLGRAAEMENAKTPVPKFLVDGIAQQRAVVTGQRNTLQHQQALRAQTVQLQAKQLARYREIKAAQAQSAG